MTKSLSADDPAGIAEAAALLRSGELVAFGTETVYGLGADATDGHAVARVFEAKGRPRFNPLICHFPDAATAFAQVEACDLARTLAQNLWPGPLTLVLPRKSSSGVSLLAGAGLATLAVRVPAHPAALALLSAAGRPVAAPSANRSGHVSPTTARHVLEGLAGRITAVLDCGPCMVGVESTVLDLTTQPPTLLRPGGVSVEQLASLIGAVGTQTAGSPKDPRSPGMLASHYAPRLTLRLNVQRVEPGEALLAFGPPLAGAGAVFQLSARADLAEAAANLFAGLRALEATESTAIAAMAVPERGLGLAINDRLRRAAAPR